MKWFDIKNFFMGSGDPFDLGQNDASSLGFDFVQVQPAALEQSQNLDPIVPSPVDPALPSFVSVEYATSWQFYNSTQVEVPALNLSYGEVHWGAGGETYSMFGAFAPDGTLSYASEYFTSNYDVENLSWLQFGGVFDYSSNSFHFEVQSERSVWDGGAYSMDRTMSSSASSSGIWGADFSFGWGQSGSYEHVHTGFVLNGYVSQSDQTVFDSNNSSWFQMGDMSGQSSDYMRLEFGQASSVWQGGTSEQYWNSYDRGSFTLSQWGDTSQYSSNNDHTGLEQTRTAWDGGAYTSDHAVSSSSNSDGIWGPDFNAGSGRYAVYEDTHTDLVLGDAGLPIYVSLNDHTTYDAGDYSWLTQSDWSRYSSDSFHFEADREHSAGNGSLYNMDRTLSMNSSSSGFNSPDFNVAHSEFIGHEHMQTQTARFDSAGNILSILSDTVDTYFGGSSDSFVFKTQGSDVSGWQSSESWQVTREVIDVAAVGGAHLHLLAQYVASFDSGSSALGMELAHYEDNSTLITLAPPVDHFFM